MRVLVTGAAGQLGAVIHRVFSDSGHYVVAAVRSALDIACHADVMRAVADAQPDVIVNCAAFNDVDGAEDRHQQALDVNAFAVRSLARAAHDRGATLVHYSTDFVFSGDTDRPYTEDDEPGPQSVYASSKYLGECFARDAERHYVFRVESLFGGPAARSSIDKIAASLRAGRDTRVFADRFVSPSYVEDVAVATARALALQAPYGLYHCVNSGWTTWYELGREVALIMAADPRLLTAVRVADVPLKARRPVFAALSNARLAAAGVPMPSWQDALARYLGRLERGGGGP
jgi:dTDP-4-dehydrorhamnose reductase